MADKSMFVTEKGAGFYRTRMLKAGDPITLSGPQARLHAALGHVESEGKVAPAKKPAADDLPALRAQYQTKFGKRPFNGWDADTLREKIAAA